uniref:Uncharacterized protein n=1 Tax=Romanomermis culicivorax TaxID=13658 RepID=A0A915I2V8_ROMCU
MMDNETNRKKFGKRNPKMHKNQGNLLFDQSKDWLVPIGTDAQNYLCPFWALDVLGTENAKLYRRFAPSQCILI